MDKFLKFDNSQSGDAVHGDRGAQCPENMPDALLLNLFLSEQSDEAMKVFVERHATKVMMVCRSVSSNTHDVDDAFQSTFLAAVKYAHRLMNVESHGAWLCRVAYNASIDNRKARYRSGNVQEDKLTENIIGDTEGALDMIAKRDEMDIVLSELFQLPLQYQECLTLRYLEGVSRKDMATRLGKTEASVKALLERGRHLLRSRLVRRGVAPASAVGYFGSLALSEPIARGLVSAVAKKCGVGVESVRNISLGKMPLIRAQSLSSSPIALCGVSLLVVCGVLLCAGLGRLAVRQSQVASETTFESVLEEESPEIPFSAPGTHDAEIRTMKNEIAKKIKRIEQLEAWQKMKLEHVDSAKTGREATMLLGLVDELKKESELLGFALVQDKEALANLVRGD